MCNETTQGYIDRVPIHQKMTLTIREAAGVRGLYQWKTPDLIGTILMLYLVRTKK